jgi:hypothetical protein
VNRTPGGPSAHALRDDADTVDARALYRVEDVDDRLIVERRRAGDVDRLVAPLGVDLTQARSEAGAARKITSRTSRMSMSGVTFISA